MIHNLSGSSDYLQHEFNKHNPKLNQAVFNLIYWSINKDPQRDINIDGSAGEAFQFLAGRYQSDNLTEFIMIRANLPEEILDNIDNIVFLYSSNECSAMWARKYKRKQPCNLSARTTFQSLAVVNQKFYRLCLPKLWQRLDFLTECELPAPMSIWTEDILLKHGNLVKSFRFKLEDLDLIVKDDDEVFLESQRSNFNNGKRISKDTRWDYPSGLGPMNVEKILRACPCIKSVEMIFPEHTYLSVLSYPLTSRFKGLFRLIPHLQHLKLRDLGCRGSPNEFTIDLLKNLPSLVSLVLKDFRFSQKASTEESFGWNVAQHQNLLKLCLKRVTCKDQTWTLSSWPQPLATLELHYCKGLTPVMVHNLLSGSAPYLTRFEFKLEHPSSEPDVDSQTDLPALKELLLDCGSGFALASFKGCKHLEMIKYRCIMNNDLWNLVEHLLSTYTWPKLLVLNLCHERWNIDRNNWKILTKKDIYEFWKYYKITLLITSEADLY
ncbi:uncharacterized protein MELLADRAFT_60998 [Melampsora larici-populina 98AG31]|uniref:F-box domain-containing protein n=1 Tax=Melampsora larici-populina (strain 98AG31 / pathotype 3-4-7) TaxID=747676 RepID=F4RCC1_MELLP|nr:uncharacterized protein MELLADRAFT_60998 [Melampsora larici-populina 98AG31]EGG09859.1 hypothetical protein MELLADRAFT_60998 [Melampsora larici-populina 98AG31]